MRDYAFSMRRPGRRRVRAVGPASRASLSPGGILGSLLHADFDVADPDITLNGGNVQSIPNRGGDSAPLAQATASLQPAYSATSFAGGPGMTGDGVDDTMACTFATSIPIGRRPYMWVVYKASSAALTFQVAGACSGAAAAPPYMVAWSNRADGNMGGGMDCNNGGGATTALVAIDTNTHLQEVGPTVGGTAAYVRDNVATNIAGAASTTLGAAITQVRALSFAGTQFSAGVVRRIIVANDMPTATQITQMRAYLRRQPYGLTF